MGVKKTWTEIAGNGNGEKNYRGKRKEEPRKLDCLGDEERDESVPV